MARRRGAGSWPRHTGIATPGAQHRPEPRYDAGGVTPTKKAPGCGASRSKTVKLCAQATDERGARSLFARSPTTPSLSQPPSPSRPVSAQRRRYFGGKYPSKASSDGAAWALSCPRATCTSIAGGHQVHAPEVMSNPSTWAFSARSAGGSQDSQSSMWRGDGRRRDVGGLPIS